jgi:hypothetical protein
MPTRDPLPRRAWVMHVQPQAFVEEWARKPAEDAPPTHRESDDGGRAANLYAPRGEGLRSRSVVEDRDTARQWTVKMPGRSKLEVGDRGDHAWRRWHVG